MQTLGDSRAAEYMKGKKTLEINPEHPIVQALKQKVDSDASGAKVRDSGVHIQYMWRKQTLRGPGSCAGSLHAAWAP